MTTITFDASGVVLRAPRYQGPDIEVVPDDPPQDFVDSGPFVDKDVSYVERTYNVTSDTYTIIVSNDTDGVAEFVSLNESVATVTAGGVVTFLLTQSCDFEVTLNDVTVTITIDRTNYAVRELVTDQTAGSLLKHCHDVAKTLVAGAPNNTTATDLFSSYTITPPAATRNTSLLFNYDWTGASINVYTGGAWIGNRKDIALISKRHAIGAKHYSLYVGDKALFSDASNNTTEATVLARYTVDQQTGYDTDLMIYYLDTDMEAAGLKIYDVLPFNWHVDYVPSFETQLKYIYGSGLAAFCHKNHENWDNGEGFSNGTVTLNNVAAINQGALPDDRFAGIGGWLYMIYDIGDLRGWDSTGIGGDSSSPMFLVINGEPVLFSTYWNAWGGSDIAAYKTAIEQIMNDLATAQADPDAGTYALSHPDLSGFNFYGSSTKTGDGALASQSSALSGAGDVQSTITATGALAAQTADIDGVGNIQGNITATGSLAAQASEVAGVGGPLVFADSTGVVPQTGLNHFLAGTFNDSEQLLAKVITDQSVSDSTTTVTTISGTGYSNTLMNSGWNVANGDASYPVINWTAGAGGFTEGYGAAITTLGGSVIMVGTQGTIFTAAEDDIVELDLTDVT
jgi:hypothetical protein